MSTSKRILTQEITDWLKNEIETSEDEVVTLFGKDDYRATDYFVQADSLRLRYAGYQLLKIFFEHHEFIIDREFYAGEILTLSKEMTGPFFIHKRKIVMFSSEHVVLAKMAGGIVPWLESFT